MASQVRAGLASLGLRSLDELVGRADLLRQRDMALAKTTGLDLSFITTYAGPVEASSKRIAQCAPTLMAFDTVAIPAETPTVQTG